MLIQTQNFPNNIEHDNNYLNKLKPSIITFEEQNDFLISRITQKGK